MSQYSKTPAPVPFYFLTVSSPDEYSDQNVKTAMQEVKDAGFGGIVFFNKPPLGFNETEYLSDFWFEVTEKFILAARELELEFWVNDGFNFPPGDAAGRIEKVAPDLKQYRLRPNPDGELIAEATPWGFPAFEEKESSSWFHHFVYDEYFKRLGKYFGNGITGFFSDADNRRINAHVMKQLNGEKYYPWSRNFAAGFKERFGYDIVPELKKLFTGSDPELAADYWQYCGELYQQWFASNHAWCQAHGVKYTFHTSDTGPLKVDDCRRSSAYSEGAPLELLSHSDYPGTDHEILVLDGGTHYDSRFFTPQVTLGGGEERLNHPQFNNTFWDVRAKLAGSAAYINGADGAMCEMFAATNFGADCNKLSRIAAWQIIQGITFIVPHAVHYRFGGETKYFAPPIFNCGTMRAAVRQFNERLTQWCHAASAGEYLVDVAVIEPTKEVWRGKDSRKFFELCDRLNRMAVGYVIVPANAADRFPLVIDPLKDENYTLPETVAEFSGGELAWMPRRINGEKYILAANIWSDKTLSGTVKFDGKVFEAEILPGEIAVFGGPFESYRHIDTRQTIRRISGDVPVEFAASNLIPFESCIEFANEQQLELTLMLPEGSSAVEFDGEVIAADGVPQMIFDDRYTAVKLVASRGKHRIAMSAAAEFDTPVLLSGEFDVKLTTVNDYYTCVKHIYQLNVYAPESAFYELLPRRKTLNTGCGWEKQGQVFYSGEVVYDLGKQDTAVGECLDLPGFTGVAELLINGVSAGRRAFAPYRFELPAGNNSLKLRCWNTMANRMERYACPSGIICEPEIRS